MSGGGDCRCQSDGLAALAGATMAGVPLLSIEPTAQQCAASMQEIPASVATGGTQERLHVLPASLVTAMAPSVLSLPALYPTAQQWLVSTHDTAFRVVRSCTAWAAQSAPPSTVAAMAAFDAFEPEDPMAQHRLASTQEMP